MLVWVGDLQYLFSDSDCVPCITLADSLIFLTLVQFISQLQ